jgi:hypothetical protein
MLCDSRDVLIMHSGHTPSMWFQRHTVLYWNICLLQNKRLFWSHFLHSHGFVYFFLLPHLVKSIRRWRLVLQWKASWVYGHPKSPWLIDPVSPAKTSHTNNNTFEIKGGVNKKGCEISDISNKNLRYWKYLHFVSLPANKTCIASLYMQDSAADTKIPIKEYLTI